MLAAGTLPAVGAPGDLSPARGDITALGVLPTVRAERLGGKQWGLAAVGAEGAWGITRGAGITVAVLDSGVDETHPDLAGHLLPAVDLVEDGRAGDAFGHGTRVAGVIAAALDGAGIAGLAGESQVLPIRILTATGEGDQNRTARGIRAAVAAGAQVINLSLSSPSQSTFQAEAIQFALDHGVVVVAAAGNRREEGSPTVFPAAYPGVIGVSSVGRDLAISDFASQGTAIDLVAPGGQILTTQVGGGWESDDGTSLAAAFVSAAVALVRAANPTLAPDAVAQVLFDTARDLGAPGRDDDFGHGLLRADRAVHAAAGLPGGVGIPSVALTVGALASGSRLSVDIDPDLATGAWTFHVQRLRPSGAWRTLRRSFTTRGEQETRIVNLPRGTYRVRVPSRLGFDGSTSVPVTLNR